MNDFQLTLSSLVKPARVISQSEILDRLSKDFYWYSPILEKQLREKKADLAVAPNSVEELRQIVSRAYIHEIPITVRGGGTGNYGQCVPLHGGLVIDISNLDKILEISPSGYVVAEPGVRLSTLEEKVRAVGWEMRCYPSTFVKSTLSGFLCGGSGGIGSITYGMLRENQNVRRLEVLTIEKEPKLIALTGDDIFRVLRAYGTNGILTQIELALGPAVRWGQLAASFDTFQECFDFCESYARNTLYAKRLVSCFEPPIPGYFTPLKKYIQPGKAMAFFEVDEAHLDDVAGQVALARGRVTLKQGYSWPRQAPLLSDYTWNHTTLWAKKANPNFTYLQCGFDPDRAREQYQLLKIKFGAEFLLHIEFTKQQGRVAPGSIPVINFTTADRLQEIIDYCESIGVSVSNPHTYHLACGSFWDAKEQKIETKLKNDPKGILNPGKIKDHPLPTLHATANF
jgi:FAD/FMN-containing dehydrogenase